MRVSTITTLKDGDTIQCSIDPCNARVKKVIVSIEDCGCIDYLHEDHSCFFACDGRKCTDKYHDHHIYFYDGNDRNIKLIRRTKR